MSLFDKKNNLHPLCSVAKMFFALGVLDKPVQHTSNNSKSLQKRIQSLVEVWLQPSVELHYDTKQILADW